MGGFCDLFINSNSWDEELGNVTSQLVPSIVRGPNCIGNNTTLPTFFLLGFAITVICVLGIFGNALSALVLLKSQFKSSVNFMLLGLTLSDTIVILYSLTSFAFPNIFGYFDVGRTYNYYLYPLISPYLFPIGFIGQTGSVYFTVAVTVERYVVVCWPLYAKCWCTNRRARLYTCIVYLFSILITFPKWFEIQAAQHNMYKNRRNLTSVKTICYNIESTPLRDNLIYKYYYVNWTYFIFMYAIPFIILVTLNGSIYKRIKFADKMRESLTMSKSYSRETSVAQMLLCVVVVFLVCNFLAMLNNALETIWDITCSTLINFSNFFVTFNSCCNFAIYYIFGQKFRNCFITTWNDLFPCISLKVQTPIPSASYRSGTVRTAEQDMELVVK